MDTTLEKRTGHTRQSLPSFNEMYSALCSRDSRYEGVFVVGVKTTGIFCRPTCTARKPKPENVKFYRNVGEAMAAGFRACKRCRPLEVAGETPDWIRDLLDQIEGDPSVRWTDQRLRTHGIQPVKLRRWFKRNYAMTFQEYQRSRRLTRAARQISSGEQITSVAIDIGYESLSGFRDALQKWSGEVPGSIATSQSPITIYRITTPLGPMVVAAMDQAICMLEFADRKDLEKQFKKLVSLTRRRVVTGEHPLFRVVDNQLQEYFAGKRKAFEIPLACPGAPFQTRVWEGLRQIPYGQTVSYKQLAEQIDATGAQRAVGTANGSNRLSILIPCHRVVRSDGKTGGYAGEAWRKQRLLEIELQG